MSKPLIIRDKDGTLQVLRFSTFRRIEHLIVIATMVLLVLTGFPQKLNGEWAGQLMGLFGGLDNVRWIHRAAGVAFCVQGALHLGLIIGGVLMGKMRLTLLPTPQDLYDAWNNLAYYFGYRKSPPAFGKFDYRQKFEYIGLILGGLVMITTGLILLYPVFASRIIPGQFIPAALAMHSNEAVLALLVLAVWHVYGAHLSPDVFPMDTSVFTGYMAAEDMKHHHPLEYYRVFPDGEPPPGSGTGTPNAHGGTHTGGPGAGGQASAARHPEGDNGIDHSAGPPQLPPT